jgi:hypothetical protein
VVSTTGHLIVVLGAIGSWVARSATPLSAGGVEGVDCNTATTAATTAHSTVNSRNLVAMQIPSVEPSADRASAYLGDALRGV